MQRCELYVFSGAERPQCDRKVAFLAEQSRGSKGVEATGD